MKKKFIAVITIFAIATLLTSCGGGEDNTGENWIFAIICLLAWLKGGK